jgi:hypothetical protein
VRARVGPLLELDESTHVVRIEGLAGPQAAMGRAMLGGVQAPCLKSCLSTIATRRGLAEF